MAAIAIVHPELIILQATGANRGLDTGRLSCIAGCSCSRVGWEGSLIPVREKAVIFVPHPMRPGKYWEEVPQTRL